MLTGQRAKNKKTEKKPRREMHRLPGERVRARVGQPDRFVGRRGIGHHGDINERRMQIEPVFGRVRRDAGNTRSRTLLRAAGPSVWD